MNRNTPTPAAVSAAYLNLVRALCILICAAPMSLFAANQEAGESGPPVSFVKDIKPILENYCVSCHGPKKMESYRIDQRDEAMEFVTSGDSENSDLYTSLVSDDEDVLMPPPAENNPLSKAQITLVKNWIDQGADWPDGVEIVQAVEVADVSVTTPPLVIDDDSSIWQRLWVAIGPLHLAVVHIPIGLLLAAGLFAMLGLRGNFVMSDCAYHCLWLGTLGAVFACVVGWSFGLQKGYGGANFSELMDMEKSIFWHRASGLIVTVFALLLALFAAGARNRDPDNGIVWKLGLIVLAVGVAFTGHKGGELTHGPQIYDDLLAIVNDFIPIGEPRVKKGEPSGQLPKPAVSGGGNPASDATGDSSDSQSEKTADEKPNSGDKVPTETESTEGDSNDDQSTNKPESKVEK